MVRSVSARPRHRRIAFLRTVQSWVTVYKTILECWSLCPRMTKFVTSHASQSSKINLARSSPSKTCRWTCWARKFSRVNIVRWSMRRPLSAFTAYSRRTGKLTLNRRSTQMLANSSNKMSRTFAKSIHSSASQWSPRNRNQSIWKSCAKTNLRRVSRSRR